MPYSRVEVGRDAPSMGSVGETPPSTGRVGKDAPSTGKEPRKSRVADRATILCRVWKTHRWGNKGTAGNQVSAHPVKQDRDL